MENVTKGVAIVRENMNPNGAYYRVEIENGGERICNITTRNYVRAHANSLLIRDALNTHNTTGKTPSELMRDNEELMEWQNSAKLIIEHFITDTHHYEMNASLLLEAEELLTKHSKDV